MVIFWSMFMNFVFGNKTFDAWLDVLYPDGAKDTWAFLPKAVYRLV